MLLRTRLDEARTAFKEGRSPFEGHSRGAVPTNSPVRAPTRGTPVPSRLGTFAPNPSRVKKMGEDFKRNCGADFATFCLSNSTGLASFGDFAFARASPEFPVVLGEDPFFDNPRGRGRKALESLRTTLYIHETPVTEAMCLTKHYDQLQTSCQRALTTVYPDADTLSQRVVMEPPHHHHVPGVLMGLLFAFLIARYRSRKQRQDTQKLLSGLAADPELKAHVADRLGITVPEPTKPCGCRKWIALGLGVIGLFLTTALIVISSLELTSFIVYQMDMSMTNGHFSSAQYVATSLVISAVLGTMGGLIMRRMGLSLVSSLFLPASSVTVLSILQHVGEYYMGNGTSVSVAMEMLVLVMMSELLLIKGAACLIKRLRAGPTPEPSAPLLFAPADLPATTASSASWFGPSSWWTSSDDQAYQALPDQEMRPVGRGPTAPVRPAQVTFSAPPAFL